MAEEDKPKADDTPPDPSLEAARRLMHRAAARRANHAKMQEEALKAARRLIERYQKPRKPRK
jgi:hypothetical protein